MIAAQAKPNTVQKSILEKMRAGKTLCSMRSITGDEVKDYGAGLGMDDVAIGTVRALIRKGLIAEKVRHQCAEGTSEGKPHELLRITYQVVE